MLELYGGSAGNIIPDRAVLVVGKRTEVSEGQLAALQASLPECVKAEARDGKIRVTAYGTSRHSAFPEGSVNACLLYTSGTALWRSR